LIGVESTGEDRDDSRKDKLPSSADRPTDQCVGYATMAKLSAGQEADLPLGQCL